MIVPTTLLMPFYLCGAALTFYTWGYHHNHWQAISRLRIPYNSNSSTAKSQHLTANSSFRFHDIS